MRFAIGVTIVCLAAGCGQSGTQMPPAPDADADAGEEPSVCTSARWWTDGNAASTRMKPGGACIACHLATPGSPPFAIAGTVYPTLHEPDDCYGAMSSAVVEVTCGDGGLLILPVNSAGNFFQFASEEVAPPFRVRVIFDGGVRSMMASQESGDCNSCHTQAGANGAPGRVRER